MQTNLHHIFIPMLLLLGQIAFGQDSALKTATEEINQLAQEKNYSPSDYSEPIISDDYVSGGIRHIYYQQSINNVGIYGTSGAVHLKEGTVVSSNLRFLPQLEKRDIRSTFQVQALEAVARLALDQNYPLSQTEVQILETNEAEPQKSTTINAPGISNRVIPMKLVYFVDEAEEVQLAWNLFIDEVGGAAYKNFIVSASDGAVLFEKNLTVTCSFEHEHNHAPTCSEHQAEATVDKVVKRSMTNVDSVYNVLPYNIESPNFGSRSMVANPWENPAASPNGWHRMFGIDYQYTLGNNVDAYSDRDNTNDPTGFNAARAFGGPDLVFDYPFDPNGTPTDYTKAAVTNLFYMNNVAHDVFYNYGFDEASGNFQEENYSGAGRQSDGVTAEAQDASGTCNANMSTPGDGANPRMQMYICGGKDGDFDNAIILHEYGHGISNRLTGGPNAVACLGNVEQMGEGWSDYFGLVLTMKPTDIATTSRTIGTFMFNQDENGAGLRPYPYTTAMVGPGSNPMTYTSIDDPGITRPHGVGAVWATMLWDMTWGLIDEYGWDADIYNGTGGNNIALRLVMEGLKIQPCSPGFVDARDAILAADLAIYGGVNRCIIWEAFARRGLGYSADQGSSNSREDGSEGYDMPPECTIQLLHTVDKETAYLGERLTFNLEAVNHLGAIAPNIIVTDTLPDNTTFYSASHGGTLNGNVVTWPAFDLPVGGTKLLELKVTINDTIDFDGDFLDDLESGGDNWKQVQISGSHVWNLQSQYHYSPSNGWFITNANITSETHLVLNDALALTDSSELSFNHFFDLEDRYDFGLVDISIDGGENWINLEDKFTQNGYNNYTQFGHYAFSRYSTEIQPNDNGYITSKADLSDFAGEVAIVRFRLLTDVNTARFGWILDDIGISNTNYALPNYGNIRNTEYDFDTQVETPVIINQSLINHTVETSADTLITSMNSGIAYADVQANDLDADGPLDTLTTTILIAGTNGTAAVVDDDSISYIPNTNFLGRDTVVYQVCDENNACESDTLFIFVIQSNSSPITMSDFATVDENSTNNTIDVQANDSDPDEPADFLTTSIVQQPTNGSASLNGDNIDYTPTSNYFGLDTILYQVCDTGNLCEIDTIFLTVLSVNQAPVAVSDFIAIDKNVTNHFIDVQANDSDPDGPGDVLVTTILQGPLNGTANVVDNDSIDYTPTTAYFGMDTIVYQICDTSNLCASDTIFITINDINEGPTTMSDNLMVAKNSTSNFVNVQLNDSDPNGVGDSLVTAILEGPNNGVASVIDDDSISYEPTMNFIGADTIIYQVCDTANICASDTVFITIYDFNEGPVAMADYIQIDKNTTNHFVNVQLNDSDPNGIGDSLITSILIGPASGTAAVINDDSISYDPNMDFVGLDTIVYQVCDTASICAADTVFITVLDVNEAPITQADYLNILENSINNYINVQSNDSDPNGVGDTLVTIIVNPATNGSTVVIDEDSIRYTPTANFVGLDTIVYQVCDTSNLCAIDTVFITVSVNNVSPVTMPDYLTINKNSLNVSIDVQANDYDPNGVGDTLETYILSGAFHGIAGVVNGDSLVYTPNLDYSGQDTIVYEVCDTLLLCTSDTVFIAISEALICDADNITKNENGVADGNYVAANMVTSSGVINNAAKVRYTAGTSITLLPGFHAEAGADFIAAIDDCSSDNSLLETPANQRTVDIADNDVLANQNQLLVRPNPFSSSAIIDYEVGTPTAVWIGLHDLTGKIVHVFVDQKEMDKGLYQYQISSTNLPSGAYWVSMRTPKSVLTKKIIILKE